MGPSPWDLLVVLYIAPSRGRFVEQPSKATAEMLVLKNTETMRWHLSKHSIIISIRDQYMLLCSLEEESTDLGIKRFI